MSPALRLQLSILSLIGVFLIGMFGYLVIESEHNPSGIDAAYMTALTLTTVGFNEVWPLSPMGKVWTIAIMTFGIITVSLSVTSLVTLFVSGELRSAHGRRRLESKIKQMQGHVVLCGYGRMGALTAQGLLERGVVVVVVENDKDVEDALKDAGLPYIMEDATEEESLQRAGLMRAGTLISVLRHDADNVFITLTAHTLRPDLPIIARAEQPATERKLLRAGASRVICPQVIGARRIRDVVTRPNVVDFVDVANRGVDLEMDEYVIRSNSVLRGQRLRESLLREKAGAMVVAIKQAGGETVYNPAPDTRLETDDCLIIVGPAGASEALDRLEQAGG